MRTSSPAILPLFRSEMQLRLLALLLLQPERAWTLDGLAQALSAARSSVHRELERAEDAGLVRRDTASRPHRFVAATDDPMFEPLAMLLQRSIGIEEELRAALRRPDVRVAVIHGSWASGSRRPDSDVDVLVVGDAPLRELRRAVRSIGQVVGRTIDITAMSVPEFRDRLEEGSGFARAILAGPTVPLVGDAESLRRL
jgi:predicted nucleotidyltransferase